MPHQLMSLVFNKWVRIHELLCFFSQNINIVMVLLKVNLRFTSQHQVLWSINMNKEN